MLEKINRYSRGSRWGTASPN